VLSGVVGAADHFEPEQTRAAIGRGRGENGEAHRTGPRVPHQIGSAKLKQEVSSTPAFGRQRMMKIDVETGEAFEDFSVGHRPFSTANRLRLCASCGNFPLSAVSFSRRSFGNESKESGSSIVPRECSLRALRSLCGRTPGRRGARPTQSPIFGFLCDFLVTSIRHFVFNTGFSEIRSRIVFLPRPVSLAAGPRHMAFSTMLRFADGKKLPRPMNADPGRR
jgi:hypothetical protein